MQYEVYTVPAGGGEAMDELNKFLRSHRVVGVEKHLVTDGQEPRWVFCVEYLESSKAGVKKGNNAGTGKPRVDYREVLNPSDFGVFSKMRDKRKEWAEKEGIPAYAIFTNEQLAKMVTERVKTLEALGKIDGVGESRLKKYGSEMLEVLRENQPSQPTAPVK